MKFLKAFVLASGIISISACEGSSPVAGPSQTDAVPLSTTLRFVSMRTGQPVAGVLMNSLVGEMQSQSDGTVRLSNVPRGSRANASAPGFLPQGFKVEGNGDIGLWPADTQLPEDFTFKAVYAANLSGRLIRPMVGSGVVLASRDILADSGAHRALLNSVGEINDAVGYISLAVGEYSGTDPAGYFIRIYVDPNDRYIRELNAAAVTYSHTSGNGVIVSVKIVMRGLGDVLPGLHLQRAMTHEMGHGVGLSHTEGYPGMMWGGIPVSRFSQMEREVLDYAGHRPPGNLWPDDSSGLSSSSSRQTVKVCVLDQAGNPLD